MMRAWIERRPLFRFPGYFHHLLFGTLFLAVSVCHGLEELLPSVDELTRRLNRVSEEHSWLDVTYNGLGIEAENVSREEFLRGLFEATDFTFDGTSSLRETITLHGFFPNLDALSERLCEEDPFLHHETDWENRRIRFVAEKDPTKGLNDRQIAKYYRSAGPFPETKASAAGGLVFPGTLIINGVRISPPLEINLVHEPKAVSVRVNGQTIEIYPFSDPYRIDRDLYAATTEEDLKAAILAKVDQVWELVATFPFSTTPEKISALQLQVGLLPGVVRTRIENDSLIFVLLSGTEIRWSIPEEGRDRHHLTMQEAFRKATEFQNRLLLDLSMGKTVFVSDRYGTATVDNGFALFSFLGDLAVNHGLPFREKEVAIRKRWKAKAPWVLEYFFTSLVREPMPSRRPPIPFLLSGEAIDSLTPESPALTTPSYGQTDAATPETSPWPAQIEIQTDR